MWHSWQSESQTSVIALLELLHQLHLAQMLSLNLLAAPIEKLNTWNYITSVNCTPMSGYLLGCSDKSKKYIKLRNMV